MSQLGEDNDTPSRRLRRPKSSDIALSVSHSPFSEGYFDKAMHTRERSVHRNYSNIQRVENEEEEKKQSTSGTETKK